MKKDLSYLLSLPKKIRNAFINTYIMFRNDDNLKIQNHFNNKSIPVYLIINYYYTKK